MTGESLRDRQRAQIRADIQRAAFRLFARRGYNTVTTDEIAAAAGVSPRTLFRHVTTKEELLLAPARHGGAEVISLLEERPVGESPDVALANAIIARTRSFGKTDTEEWRAALVVAPQLLERLKFHTAADRERATGVTAARMGVDPNLDIRPGLLVHLSFAAADFGFQRWVRQDSTRPSLDRCVAEALDAVRSPRWSSKSG
ncbi:TetR/AcrR family transcriptional regulator [Mycobacterium vicinigordonae]|uniref:TetR family transcriptional regulator n=1 Tax=Mycobacterium vicinigordonae TaxID=1719132 RepID=A0A7D6E4P2_9MYCO|nr:TetR/AcrR family transcriptional regulator [Mycobacterium vicinigordonae]QLL07262.1 TetR family transcriptional regulator [Mycobacterium vicinigordonae]